MGPPVVRRRWSAATVKAAIADGRGEAPGRRARRTPPTPTASGSPTPLRRLGWRPPADGRAASRAGQPRYVFQVPLAGRDRGRAAQGLQPAVAAQHQEGRQGRRRGAPGRRRRPAGVPRALPRDRASATGSPPRPLAYFQRMWEAMRAEDPDRLRLYLARARGRPGRRDDDGAGRRARLVLLRRLVHRQARGPRLQRHPVADDARRARRPARRSTTCAASPTPSTPTTRTSG